MPSRAFYKGSDLRKAFDAVKKNFETAAFRDENLMFEFSNKSKHCSNPACNFFLFFKNNS